MGVIIGVLVGYAMGAKAGPEAWTEIEDALHTIYTSEEVRDLVAGAADIVRQVVEKRAEVLASLIGSPERPGLQVGGVGAPVRFVDEYRDPTTARALVAQITTLAGDDSFKFMEVCGGHTHTIYRHGIEHVLPAEVELVHGPGCPVCVIPMGRIDDAIAVAEQPGVIFTSFGDMMRVPGSRGNLLQAKADGADVRFVYSPLDALRIATENPERDVVFFAVGFETTAPSTALTLLEARDRGVTNFFVFSNHVTIVPPLRAILESPDLRLDGFLGPGHVSTVVVPMASTVFVAG